jgi:hypothetical protein
VIHPLAFALVFKGVGVQIVRMFVQEELIMFARFVECVPLTVENACVNQAIGALSVKTAAQAI